MALEKLSAEDIGLPRFDVQAAPEGGVFDLSSHQRAREALDLALSIEADGFNVFVVGADRSGRLTATMEFLEQQVAGWSTPTDWVYLNNFKMPHRPKPFALPPGRGREFAEAMEILRRNLREAVARAFSGQSYQKAVADLKKPRRNSTAPLRKYRARRPRRACCFSAHPRASRSLQKMPRAIRSRRMH